MTPSSTSQDIFATTRWTVVVAAGRKSDTQARRALEELCRTYWYPLYAYVRRQGHSKEDEEDLTQAFFARLLEKDYLSVTLHNGSQWQPRSCPQTKDF